MRSIYFWNQSGVFFAGNDAGGSDVRDARVLIAGNCNNTLKNASVPSASAEVGPRSGGPGVGHAIFNQRSRKWPRPRPTDASVGPTAGAGAAASGEHRDQ